MMSISQRGKKAKFLSWKAADVQGAQHTCLYAHTHDRVA